MKQVIEFSADEVADLLVAEAERRSGMKAKKCIWSYTWDPPRLSMTRVQIELGTEELRGKKKS